MLTIKDETFHGQYPFTPRYYSHQGIDIHYVDEGSGEPVVMVHGDPTWGFLYRHFISALSKHHRCIVPDHMGMGKSSIPEDRSLYRLEQHSPTSKRSSCISTCTTLPSFCTIGEDL